jgi:hypothetical protein
MTSHIDGVSPGTDEGAMTIRIPSPTIASAKRHIDGGFRGLLRSGGERPCGGGAAEQRDEFAPLHV